MIQSAHFLESDYDTRLDNLAESTSDQMGRKRRTTRIKEREIIWLVVSQKWHTQKKARDGAVAQRQDVPKLV